MPVAHALAHGVLAGGPREDEVDAREQVRVLEQVDHLGAPRRAERLRDADDWRCAPRRGAARAGPVPARGAQEVVDPAALRAHRLAVEQVDEDRRVVVAPLDRDAVVQVDGSGALDDDLEGAAHGREATRRAPGRWRRSPTGRRT